MAYLEQQNYNKETIKELQKEQKGVDFPIVNGGYPTFNTCAHTTLDMSNAIDHASPDYQQTLSIKLEEDRYVTICVMKLGADSKGKIVDSERQICLDIKFHGEGKTRLMTFTNGRSQSLQDFGLLGVINELK